MILKPNSQATLEIGRWFITGGACPLLPSVSVVLFVFHSGITPLVKDHGFLAKLRDQTIIYKKFTDTSSASWMILGRDLGAGRIRISARFTSYKYFIFSTSTIHWLWHIHVSRLSCGRI